MPVEITQEEQAKVLEIKDSIDLGDVKDGESSKDKQG